MPPHGRATGPSAAGKRGTDYRWVALRVAVSIGLLAFLLTRIDIAASLNVMREARVGPLLMMLGALVLDRLLAAWRWHILLLRDPGIGFWRVFRLILSSGFAGHAMPGSVGVEVARIYGASRSIEDLGRILSSVIVERMFALLAIAVLVLVGLALTPEQMPPALAPLAWLGLVTLLLGSFLLMSPGARRLSLRLLPGTVLTRPRAKLQETYTALDRYSRRPGLMLVSLGAALAFQLLRVAMTLFGAWALGSALSPLHFLVIVPTMMLVNRLPISIAGLGVQEAGFVYLFGLVGMSAATALPLSLLLHLATLAALVPGAWLYWRRGLDL